MEMLIANCATPRGWLFDRMNEFAGDFDSGFATQGQPPADVFEDAEAYHFYFDLPGVKPDTLDVKVENSVLVLEAERTRPELPKEARVHRAERKFRKIHRAFRLPTDVAQDRVSASYRDGVLHLTMAKPAAAKPVKIEVTRN